jgi:hypothetical protein
MCATQVQKKLAQAPTLTLLLLGQTASQVSHDADADDEEEGVQSSRGKKQAGAKGAKQAAGKGRGRAAAAAATESVEVTEEGSEDGAGDEDGPKGRRRSLAHLRAQLHEQVSSCFGWWCVFS